MHIINLLSETALRPHTAKHDEQQNNHRLKPQSHNTYDALDAAADEAAPFFSTGFLAARFITPSAEATAISSSNG
jgi:hypothetical protein